MSTPTADLTRAQDDVDRLTDLRDGLDAGTAVAADVGVLTGLDRGDRAYEQVLTELEDAINYWRSVRPSSGEERTLSPEVNALATVYATMIFHHLKAMPLDALNQNARQCLETWRTLPA